MDPELARAIGRLEGKIDEIGKNIAAHFVDDKEAFKSLHKKIETMRGHWKYAAGAAAVVVFIVSHFGEVLVTNFLQK